MTTIHLSDTDIQLFSLGEAGFGPGVAEHISQCEFCAGKAKNYRWLFYALNDAPKPILDFDVADMVLAALPEHKKSPGLSDRFVYFIAFAAICILGTLALLFQKDVFGKFDESDLMAMYVLSIPIVGILIWQSYELYEKYRKKMRQLTGMLQQ